MPDTQWTYTDGTQVTLHEDGSVTVKDTDGTTTHVDAGTGDRTITPAGGAPVKDTPFNSKTKDGDTTHSFTDGTRYKFKKGPPPRFQRTQSKGKPRTIEIDLTNGERRLVEKEDGPETTDKPSDTKSIDPSTHPKPKEKPKEDPKEEPKEDPKGGGKGESKEGGKGKPKKKKPKRPKKPKKPKKKSGSRRR
jgi:hypothetical protein